MRSIPLAACLFAASALCSNNVPYGIGYRRAAASSQEGAPAMSYAYQTYDTMITFGDSITQMGSDATNNGWSAQMSYYYQRQMTVLNMGFSGYNTSRALDIIEHVYPKTTAPAGSQVGKSSSSNKRRAADDTADETELAWPDREDTFPSAQPQLRLVTIFFGANDAQEKGSNGYNPLEEYSAQLGRMVSLLQSPGSDYYSPNTRIIIISPPPVGDLIAEAIASETNSIQESFNKNVGPYVNAAKDVARNASVPFINLYDEIENRVTSNPKSEKMQFGGYEQYLSDGVHLTADGNTILYDLLMATIKSAWPELMPPTPPRAAPPRSSTSDRTGNAARPFLSPVLALASLLLSAVVFI